MVLEIVLLIVFIYLGIPALYIFVFAIAGKFGKLRVAPATGIYRKFAVLIPSYKEDEVILDSAKQALNQTYPKDRYDIVVIADSLQPETVQKLKAMPLKVIEVSFDQSTKAKSLNKALEVLPEIYDYALVLDVDNIMAKDFLEKINATFVRTGVKALQGHRIAKNLNTNFAILDGISEEINNHIFRKGHRVLGLSSGLIGSGMAFDYAYFKEVMATNKAVGGFDKELELKLLRSRIKIEYVEDALVYDEKVENAEVFQNQRKRWMSAQLHYFRKYFLQGVWHLLTKGNVDFFDKAFQQFLLPRVLLLGSIIVLTTAAIVCQFAFDIPLYPGVNLWMMIFFFNIGGLLMAVPDQYYNKRTLNAALSLPKAIVIMFLTLFKLKGANKKFIHTPHSTKINTDIKSEKVA
ncbi:MAG: glycosyltransferase family 2 protein [Cytophagaceae bacterium]|nr:glycosyltransferase family 2 protein [Cytophagaceae bacterium]